MAAECPAKVRIACPVTASQSFAVISQLPDRRRVPSGENATEETELACPSMVRMGRPVATSHSLSVLSLPPDSARVPSGESATDKTQSVCQQGYAQDAASAHPTAAAFRLRCPLARASRLPKKQRSLPDASGQ
jgi:hypothetical protein